MKRLRHIDVTMTLLQVASLSVVSLTEACHLYCQAVGNAFADDNVFVHYVQNCVTRQQHVYLLQEFKTRYFCDLLIAWTVTLNFLRIIAIGTTLFQYRTAYEKTSISFSEKLAVA